MDTDYTLMDSQVKQFLSSIENLVSDVERKRVALGWTQARLAKESGVAQATISRIEAGEQKNLRLETVIALANVLGIEAQDNSTHYAKMVDEVMTSDYDDLKSVLAEQIDTAHNLMRKEDRLKELEPAEEHRRQEIANIRRELKELRSREQPGSSKGGPRDGRAQSGGGMAI